MGGNAVPPGKSIDVGVLMDSSPEDGEDGPERSVGKTRDFLVFRSGAWYAVDAAAVEAIADFSEPTFLPRAPAYVLGLMNLAGQPVAVIDLPTFLQITGSGAEGADDGFRRVLMVVGAGMKAGIRADQVVGVAETPLDQIRALPAAQQRRLARYTSGEFDWRDRLITILDVETLLAGARVTG